MSNTFKYSDTQRCCARETKKKRDLALLYLEGSYVDVEVRRLDARHVGEGGGRAESRPGSWGSFGVLQ